MHPDTGLESEDRQPCKLTPRDCEEGGDGVEGARSGRPLAKALGDRAHHLLHHRRCLVVMGVVMGRLEAQQAAVHAADGRSRRGEMGRSIDRCTSRSTRKRRHATSSWLAAWRPVTVEIV